MNFRLVGIEFAYWGVFFSRAEWLCAEVGVPCLCFAVSRVTLFGLCAKSNFRVETHSKRKWGEVDSLAANRSKS